MEKKKVFIILGGLVAVGTALYFIFRKNGENPLTFAKSLPGKILGENASDTKVSSSSSGSNVMTQVLNPGSGSSSSSSSFPLKKGMKGDNVKTMQKALNSAYSKGLVVDGIFGPNTEKAVLSVLGTNVVSQENFKKLTSAATAGTILKPATTVVVADGAGAGFGPSGSFI